VLNDDEKRKKYDMVGIEGANGGMPDFDGNCSRPKYSQKFRFTSGPNTSGPNMSGPQPDFNVFFGNGSNNVFNFGKMGGNKHFPNMGGDDYFGKMGDDDFFSKMDKDYAGFGGKKKDGTFKEPYEDMYGFGGGKDFFGYDINDLFGKNFSSKYSSKKR